MILFLTSSPTGDLDGKYQVEGIDNRNGFCDRLRQVWPKDARCLMITAFPDQYEDSEEMTAFFKDAVAKSGLSCQSFDLWDDRTEDISLETLQSYQVIWLGGGHVPTQNAFFQRLSLREKMESYDGIVIGISAGTMNCADKVYAQPELAGEATDPSYERWLRGLALTDINVLPHYQMLKDDHLDGMHLFRDISCPDSKDGHLIALIDGSYIEIIREGRNPLPTRVLIHGDAWKVQPHGLEKINGWQEVCEI